MAPNWLLAFCLALLLAIAVSAGARQTPSTATVSPSQAHAALEKVLARPEFAVYDGKKDSRQNAALTKWYKDVAEEIARFWKKAMRPIKAFFRAIGRFFSRLLPDSPPNAPDFSGLQKGLRILLFTLLGLAVVFLLALLGLYIVKARRPKSGKEREELPRDEAGRRKIEPSLWERSLLDAEALWNAGEEREALRQLYRACLVLLDARGVLRYDESRANGEVLRELRRQGKGDISTSLAPVIRVFDRGWYGVLPISGDEFTRAMNDSRCFRAAVVEERNA